MTEEEKLSIAGQLAVMDGKLDHIHDSLCAKVKNGEKRTKFLETIVFGFIGLIVLSVLTTIGGVVIWGITQMGWHKGE